MFPPQKPSKKTYLAAVDLGATSGRVILGTWSDERLALQEAHRFPNAYRELGFHAYWDIGTLWHEVRIGLLKAAALLPAGAQLASVGVDTWGCDHVLLDDAGRLVFPLHAYRDNRVQPGLRRLNKDTAASVRLYAETGIPNLFYNTSLQLEETLGRFPEISRLAARCLFLPDYFNFLLSGKLENELTISSTSQLLGLGSPDAEWSEAALAHFGIPQKWFRPPILPGTRLGAVREIPELRGTQVIAVPGHDTACAYDAMPAAEDGTDLFLSSGTWSLIGFESAQPVIGSAAQNARLSNERAGGGDFRPLTNIDGLFLLEQIMGEFADRPKNDKDWASLVSAAVQLPASPALLWLNDGSFANPESMRATIDAQLRKRKLPLPRSLVGYARLIWDSLGQGHADSMRLFEGLTGGRFRRILMVGGGSKNRLLCQATADAAGIPVVSFSLEGTAVGNLARQLIALGAVKDLAHFRAKLSTQLQTKTYTPGSI